MYIRYSVENYVVLFNRLIPVPLRFWVLQSARLYLQMSLRCWSSVQYLLSVGGCSPIDRTHGFYVSSKPEFIRPLFEDTVIWAEWLCTRPPHKFHCILICT